MFKFLVPFASFFLAGLALMGQSVRIEDVSMREVYVESFTISKNSKATVSGHFSLMSEDIDDSFFGSAWIYNSETNEVIWELQNSEISKSKNGKVDINETISISKGNYELYFSTYPNWFKYNATTKSKGKWDKLFKAPGAMVWDMGDMFGEFKKESGDWFVQVKSNDLIKNGNNEERTFKNEFIAFKKARNDQSYRKTFETTKSVKFRVIAQGEGVNDRMVDYGVIKNIDTREIIWNMTYSNTTYAGGAEKNRRIDEAIELKPGRYEIVYKTDDSHSYNDWNDAPPYDAIFWGIVLLTIDQNSVNNLKFTTAEALPSFIDINKVGDSKVIKKYFKILKTCKVNVYAVGEGSYKQMSDYGWIENVDNSERIWQMEYDETEHAGGAEKNRLEDVIITLEPGVYLAYYVTDDSHSYEDWNSDEPLNPEDWGMKIRILEKGNTSDYAEVISKYSSPNLLVNLTPIGDDANENTEFVLTKSTRVKIVAIGEGSGGEMFDYGWIEDEESGEVVWEMTYRRTKHAGGAEKNRKIEQIVSLEQGRYKVFYQSDGSHAFGDWNSAPPDDQSGWGIRIYKNE